MNMTADVIIIGGAVMGSSIAWWLTKMQPGLDVLVLERDPTFARASTALSVASIRQQFTTAVNVRISRFGIDFIRNFADRIGPEGGVPSLGLKENGYLFLASTSEGASILENVTGMQRSEGAATELWSPSQVKARFPWLETGDLTAASFGPRDEGWFDNMGLMAGFRNAAKAQGVRFVTARATGLRMAGNRVVAVEFETPDGGRGLASGENVVNAAGTRAAEILRWAGLDLAVEPRKRTVFVIDAPNARHPEIGRAHV